MAIGILRHNIQWLFISHMFSIHLFPSTIYLSIPTTNFLQLPILLSPTLSYPLKLTVSCLSTHLLPNSMSMHTFHPVYNLQLNISVYKLPYPSSHILRNHSPTCARIQTNMQTYKHQLINLHRQIHILYRTQRYTFFQTQTQEERDRSFF